MSESVDCVRTKRTTGLAWHRRGERILQPSPTCACGPAPHDPLRDCRDTPVFSLARHSYVQDLRHMTCVSISQQPARILPIGPDGVPRIQSALAFGETVS